MTRARKTKTPLNKLRLGAAALLIIGALVLPWWALIMLALAALWISPTEEILIAGILVDVLYGGNQTANWIGSWAMTLLFGVLYLSAWVVRFWFRRHIRGAHGPV